MCEKFLEQKGRRREEEKEERKRKWQKWRMTQKRVEVAKLDMGEAKKEGEGKKEGKRDGEGKRCR